MPDRDEELIQMLLARLERVPADSIWAHRASGLRGALLEALDKTAARDAAAFDSLTRQALRILERAAREKGRGSSKLNLPSQGRQ